MRVVRFVFISVDFAARSVPLALFARLAVAHSARFALLALWLKHQK
jgi:hypothetical protein